jgi:hypothetical protein
MFIKSDIEKLVKCYVYKFLGHPGLHHTIRCFTTFIWCYGCANVSVLNTLPLLFSTKLFDVALNSVYLPRGKLQLQHNELVEAIDPFKWDLTSLSNTYQLSNNLLLWMYILTCPYSVTAALIGQAFGIFPRNLVTSQWAIQSVVW